MQKNRCTCIALKGPRMEDNPGYELCPACVEGHKAFFPAFPGDPSWRLNHGAIDRNVWGIRASQIETRNIEAVSKLQLTAAHEAAHRAMEDYFFLAGLFEQEDKNVQSTDRN